VRHGDGYLMVRSGRLARSGTWAWRFACLDGCNLQSGPARSFQTLPACHHLLPIFYPPHG